MKQLATFLSAFAVLLTFSCCAQAQTPPFAGAAKMTCDDALKQAPKDDTSLAPLDKTFREAAVKQRKSPKDAKVKKTFVDAANKYADKAIGNDSKLNPAVKYRAVLALNRMTLAVDPKNQHALDQKKQIEDIYKQMGREVPK